MTPMLRWWPACRYVMFDRFEYVNNFLCSRNAVSKEKHSSDVEGNLVHENGYPPECVEVTDIWVDEHGRPVTDEDLPDPLGGWKEVEPDPLRNEHLKMEISSSK